MLLFGGRYRVKKGDHSAQLLIPSTPIRLAIVGIFPHGLGIRHYLAQSWLTPNVPLNQHQNHLRAVYVASVSCIARAQQQGHYTHLPNIPFALALDAHIRLM